MTISNNKSPEDVSKPKEAEVEAEVEVLNEGFIEIIPKQMRRRNKESKKREPREYQGERPA